jgi:hypothetical protein
MIKSERSEHLLEISNVTKLLGEVISTDSSDGRLRINESWTRVPGGADPHPFMPGEFVDAPPQQRLPIDRRWIVSEDDVVPIESLRIVEWPA